MNIRRFEKEKKFWEIKQKETKDGMPLILVDAAKRVNIQQNRTDQLQKVPINAHF